MVDEISNTGSINLSPNIIRTAAKQITAAPMLGILRIPVKVGHLSGQSRPPVKWLREWRGVE